jgi:ADP-sugar diphosphatase
MLLVLQPDGSEDESEKYVILTLQPRIPAGGLAFLDLPAGMLDDSGTFTGTEAKEIREETVLEI